MTDLIKAETAAIKAGASLVSGEVTIEPPPLAGVNVLLEGPSGTGKTHSLGTLVEADSKLQVFVLAIESGLESLLGYWRDRGKEVPSNLHWHVLAAPKASFAELLNDANLINTMNLEGLAKLSDPNRSKHDQYIKLLTALNNFADDRTGEKFGSVDSWGTNRVIVLDGLTGVSNAAMANVVGGKAVRSQSDWGIAQGIIEKLLRNLCDGCKCHFVLLSHIDRETDAVMGGTKIMTSTLGAKLAPKLPAMFSDVILSVRNGDKWVWDTGNAMADLKTRNLPIAGNLQPTFKPIIEKWKQRGGVIE